MMEVSAVHVQLGGDAYEAAPNGGNQRFQEFYFLDLLQHSQCRASDVFVGMLLCPNVSPTRKHGTVGLRDHFG